MYATDQSLHFRLASCRAGFATRFEAAQTPSQNPSPKWVCLDSSRYKLEALQIIVDRLPKRQPA